MVTQFCWFCWSLSEVWGSDGRPEAESGLLAETVAQQEAELEAAVEFVPVE